MIILSSVLTHHHLHLELHASRFVFTLRCFHLLTEQSNETSWWPYTLQLHTFFYCWSFYMVPVLLLINDVQIMIRALLLSFFPPLFVCHFQHCFLLLFLSIPNASLFLLSCETLQIVLHLLSILSIQCLFPPRSPQQHSLPPSLCVLWWHLFTTQVAGCLQFCSVIWLLPYPGWIMAIH